GGDFDAETRWRPRRDRREVAGVGKQHEAVHIAGPVGGVRRDHAATPSLPPDGFDDFVAGRMGGTHAAAPFAPHHNAPAHSTADRTRGFTLRELLRPPYIPS